MSPDAFAAVLTVIFIVLPVAAGIVWSKQQNRVNQAIKTRLARLAGQDTLLGQFDWWTNGYRLSRPGEADSRWKRGVIAVTPSRLVVFERSTAAREILSFTPDQLRWFGRPRKYTSGCNEIWLHVETERGWQLLKLRLYRDTMQQLVRVLKQFAAPELVEAYRRRRPYVHYGPVSAQPAAQDIHGAWTLAAPLMLYLMPRFLVILDQQTVLRKIPLEAVQQVGALRRLDAPHAQGLVRFRAEEETFAFAMNQHDAFAAALAEAAKRTLEAPLERKQKAKDDTTFPEVEDQLLADELPPKRLSL